jgi:hypothetical protein
MRAFIKRDKKNSEALWLIIERKKEKNFSIIFDYLEDEEGYAYPILEDELDAIKEAIEKFKNK